VHKIFAQSILISSISLTSSTLFAESTSLGSIMITANRYSQPTDESLASVSVITRSDIEQSAATDLSTLLSSVTGIVVKPSGPSGQLTSVFMRGTNSNHVLTIVDGIKLYSATAGSTAFQHIPLDQIERIEIVRGPRSSLYGSEAIGGVIQIFTHKGSMKPSATINVAAGTHNTREMSAAFSGSTQNADLSLNAKQSSTNGIDVIKHTTENDDDGYTNDSISARVNYRFNPEFSLQSSFMNTRGDTEYDSCFNSTTFLSSDDCNSKSQQQVFSNTLKFTPDGMWNGQLQIGTSKDFDDNFADATREYTFETKRESISFTNDLIFSAEHIVVLGIDYADDEVSSTFLDSTSPSNRSNTGTFAVWSNRFDKLKVSASIRRDDNEQFDVHNTGNIALGHPITSNLDAFISYGTAFKAPTFNDLYSSFGGNPLLKPEESNSTEIGIRGTHQLGSWSFNVFQTNIDELIISVPTGTFSSISSNVAKAEITGAEFTSTLNIGGWNSNLSLSYVDPINKSGANDGKVLQSRAKQTLSLGVKRDFQKITFGSSIIAQSKRYTTADNSASIAGYGIVNISADYHVTKDVMLSAKLNNLLDKEYVLNEGFGTTYNTLGRTVFVNLSYTM